MGVESMIYLNWQKSSIANCVALVLLLVFGNVVYAQVDMGVLEGTIKDQSGAVVPQAKVTIINEGTALALSRVAGADGSYVFDPLKIGSYTVEAEFPGFQKTTHPHVVVNVQQTVVVNLTLTPGQLTQSIEVTAAVPVLQTGDASVGEVVASKAINDLPLNGRNFTFLAQLTAGVNEPHQEGRGMAASGSFTANGVTTYQNNYLLDGVDNNSDLVDFLNGTAYVVLPPVDAIQEFKVEINNYSAQIGRAAGAVLNATTKSGTNQIHGDVWEFLRNDKFDSADFFENAGGLKKGKFRQNQFGFTLGGPVYFPHVYNGKNKTFFFMDYQGTRVRQANPEVLTVPTVLERSSGYTNFLDQVTAGGSPRTDTLNRTFPLGTIFDPATTRQLTAGQVDPVTGLKAAADGPVRDPFYSNGSIAGMADFTAPSVAQYLNQLPATRLDSNAIKLLNLFPLPTGPGIINNFSTNPVEDKDFDTFDVRVNHNFSNKDQLFGRFSFMNEPDYKPAPFAGVADGGNFGYNQGTFFIDSRSGALSETHSFSPTLINEARFGMDGLLTARVQASGHDLTNIPGQFGIQGIPQDPSNGGLPEMYIGTLSQLGGSGFYPSTEWQTTVQLTDNMTKTYKSHTFKGGFEFQHLKFATLQPAWSRGEMQFDGVYTGIPNQSDGRTGAAQLLLLPQASPYLNAGTSGVDNVNSGADYAAMSNIATTDDGRNYYGAYFQDDWKATPKLTLNLGLRWDYFEPMVENHGAQANIVPGSPAEYLIPAQRKNETLSPSFLDLMAKDVINIVYTNNQGLQIGIPKTNFAPRFGFAYRATPKLVVRGGYGIFYGGFENIGYGPNIGENYPFVYNFNFYNFTPTVPTIYTNPNGSTCGIATMETGFSCTPLVATAVNASGLGFKGYQYGNNHAAYTQGFNFTVEYQLTPNTGVTLAYVGTQVRHQLVQPGIINATTEILPPGTNTSLYVPWPDFAQGNPDTVDEGNSYYNGLQFKIDRHFGHGLSFLGTYTWSKVMSDAEDLLDSNDKSYRAASLPGFGIQRDYGLAEYDVRNAVHFSGGYELPFGHGKQFLTNMKRIPNAILGGWSTNWILTLEDGQPQTIPCVIATTANFGCNAFFVPGANPIGGPHDVNNYYNAAAFTNPPVATAVGQTDFAPLGGMQSQVVGPGFHRMDWSLFKQFQTSERTHMEFRAEFFNLTNHPNFSRPSDTNFSDLTFGVITSTRDSPNDPREIQFALKFYW